MTSLVVKPKMDRIKKKTTLKCVLDTLYVKLTGCATSTFEVEMLPALLIVSHAIWCRITVKMHHCNAVT